MTGDMTKGSPLRLILRFSLPVLIGNIFQQLYSIVDTIIVGRCVGNDALAAVGSTGALSFLILGFAIGITGGFSVIASQRFGAQDEEGVKRSAAASTQLCVLITVLLTAVSLLTAKPLLRLMNTPEDIFQDAYTYISVIFIGIGASIYYNMIAGILRALGDSKTPLYFLILSSLLNIGLDLLFILTFSMGVAGAAWATVLSQLISAVLCTLYAAKRFPILRLHRKHFRPDFRFMWAHLRIGLPMALQFSVTAVGIMILQSAINAFGSNVVASFTAANKVEIFVTQTFVTLSVTMATYCGQNLGAGDIFRLKQGLKTATWLGLLCSIVASLINIFLGTPLSTLFLETPSEEILYYAQQYLTTIAIFYPMLAMLYVYRSSLQAMDAPAVPMLGGVLELAARFAVCTFLPQFWGYAAVCLATPAAWIAAAVPLMIKAFFLLRKLSRQAEKI